MCLTGGEPLIRPDLIADLAEEAHNSTTAVCCITGMFFAKSNNISHSIWNAIKKIDHLTVSIDIYHEMQIERKVIFKVLHQIIDEGVDISIQTTGTGKDDPYLLNLIDEIKNEFNEKVPIDVSLIREIGRGKSLNLSHTKEKEISNFKNYTIEPCSLAAWPVVAFDGNIVGCCNQIVVRPGPRPSHLVLGNIKETDWDALQNRVINNSVLRALRTYGPYQLLQDNKKCEGYCESCYKLGTLESQREIESLMSKPSSKFVEKYIQSVFESMSFLDSYGIPEFSNLFNLGLKTNK